MKKTILKISMLFFALVLVTSCGSDDDGPAEAAPVKFRALIAGQNVRTDVVTATLSNNGGRLSINVVTDFGPLTMTVGSSAVDAPAVAVQDYIIDETGTAQISINSLDANFSSSPELGGSITISEINMEEMTVFGSFGAILANTLDDTDTIAITNGALFNVNFTVQ